MSFETLIFLFVILGLVSGLFGGLLGISGGVITVPILYFIFQYTGLADGRPMQVAVSTSLAAGFITVGISTLAQLRKKAVQWSVIRYLVPGLAVGSIAGSLLAHNLSSALLSHFFGGMAILLGIYFLFPQFPHPHVSHSPNPILSLFGLVIGSLSTLLGIGGGSLIFPVLLSYHLPVKHCSANASAATAITTLIGSLTFLVIAWSEPHLPLTIGYIEWPAFLSISAGAIVSVPLGVHLSHTLNVVLVKQISGGMLALIGLSMLFL